MTTEPRMACMQLKCNEHELISAGIPLKRIEATRTDLQHRISAAHSHTLSWGAFTVRKPSNSQALVIGGGPLGSFVAMRLSQSGVSNVSLKVLPTIERQVIEMVSLAGISTVESWEDLEGSHWGSIIIAVKTHWLPQIALEMSGCQVREAFPADPDLSDAVMAVARAGVAEFTCCPTFKTSGYHISPVTCSLRLGAV
jgi:hypothetical protein